MCYTLSHMKTASVRELRNNYARVLQWVARGEEVEVTRHGKIVARVVPPAGASSRSADWSRSAALARPAWSTTLTASASDALRAESQGR